MKYGIEALFFIMKQLLLSCFLFNFTNVLAQNYMPTVIKNQAKSVAEFLPVGWVAVDSIKWDLNNDQMEDIVIVFQNKDSVNYFDTRSEDTIRIIPAILLIAFKTHANGLYQKIEQNGSCLIDNNIPATNLNPYCSMKIENGILEIDFSYDYINADFYFYTYKFRYQNATFELIGAEIIYTRRVTFDYKNYSFNFMTAKGYVKTGNGIDTIGIKETVTWFKIKSSNPKLLKSFVQPGSNFEVVKGVFL
jgi:hypothetical protein